MEDNNLNVQDASLMEQSKEDWSKPEMNSISITKTTLGGAANFNSADLATELS